MRSCDSCTACCGPGLAVQGAGKASHENCKHLTAAGCAIYNERPTGCRVWNCLWLRELVGQESERPNRVGYFFDVVDPAKHGLGFNLLTVYEAWPGAFDDPAVQASLGQVAQKYPIMFPHQGRLVGPPELLKIIQTQSPILQEPE